MICFALPAYDRIDLDLGSYTGWKFPGRDPPAHYRRLVRMPRTARRQAHDAIIITIAPERAQ